MRRLIVLGCTKTKRRTSQLQLAALERYNGASFRMVRHHLSCLQLWKQQNLNNARTLDVLILSAKHGLLLPDALIEDYDQVMTSKQADFLRGAVQSDMTRILGEREPYEATLIHLGPRYLCTLAPMHIQSITPLDEVVRINITERLGLRLGELTFTTGGIGTRLGQIKHWLAQ